MTIKSSESKQLNKDPEERISWRSIDWKSVLRGLVGSNIRETIADIRVIREGFRERKAAKIARQQSAVK